MDTVYDVYRLLYRLFKKDGSFPFGAMVLTEDLPYDLFSGFIYFF